MAQEVKDPADSIPDPGTSTCCRYGKKKKKKKKGGIKEQGMAGRNGKQIAK